MLSFSLSLFLLESFNQRDHFNTGYNPLLISVRLSYALWVVARA